VPSVPGYAYYAFGSAVGLATLSLISKALVRYRICNSGLVTWGIGAGAGLVGGVFWGVLRAPFPSQALWPLLGAAAAVQTATWLVNRAIQEGDLSTVVPLLSVKIPIAALMALVLLGETHGVGTYAAVGLAGAGAVLFGVGRPMKAQGGHGMPPAVSILFACAGAATFALSDQLAKLGLDRSGATEFLVWTVMLRGAFCAAMLARPGYRRYRVTALDWGLFLAGGGVTVAVLGSLYEAFRLSDGVTLTNVILGTRGLFGLLLGATLGRLLRVPLEKQPARIYLLRVFGTGLVFAAMLMVLTG
jgi:uncharacterized membrane protein